MSTNSIHHLIDQEDFFHHYQPLFNISESRLIGYEVLFRSSLYTNPESAFQQAYKSNRLYELEVKSIDKALHALAKHGITVNDRIFLNAYPSTIIRPSFQDFMNQLLLDTKINSKQIILEINEAEIVSDVTFFQEKINELQKDGYSIAIDDFGKGTASLRAIIELSPNYIKMDRYFANDLSTSPSKQEMIRSILTFCKNTHAHLILEGVENSKDLATAKVLGISYIQGYLLGKPSALPSAYDKR